MILCEQFYLACHTQVVERFLEEAQDLQFLLVFLVA